MVIRVRIILLYCLLAAVAGCATKSEVTQQTSAPQQAASPKQPAPAPTATAASNVANEQQQQQNVNAGTGAAGAQMDACALITRSEVEAVQGDSVRDTKSTNRSSGSLAFSQCFYTLATFNKSVSLEVTRAADASRSGIKEFWEKTFHKKAGSEEERDEEEREEKEKGEAKPVAGIGDEAFYSGNPNSGALYVLKNNAIIRISLGGPEQGSVKIDKSKALIQKALGRL